MSSLRGVRIALIAALILACADAMALGQEFRGSITGRIVDNNGAAVANAAVTVTNKATNTSSSTTTNGDGDFTALYLIPGSYNLTVEAAGFKKSTRQDIGIRVGDKLQIDLQLEVGNVSETVNVTSNAPLLETTSASAGQVIDSRRIQDLPLSDRNPFTLSRLAPGVVFTGNLGFQRSFDNNGTSAIIVDGAPGGNEFTLDGIANNDRRRVAFVPPADAVQEFKIETASFDAQQGHTAGGNVNVTLKSGANDYHGSAYYWGRNDAFVANDFFTKTSQLLAGRKNKPGALRYHLYGGTLGGPVRLPKRLFGPFGYDGRDKSFFFFSYEGFKDIIPEPVQPTVPTQAQRNGDFSALLSQGIVIYDPLTARAEGSRIRRDPFPGNRIPENRLSQIAKNALTYYPLPNQPGDAQGRNNYFSVNPRTDDFFSWTARYDQNLSTNQRYFFRYSHNNRREFRNHTRFPTVNGVRPTGGVLDRINDAVAYDHVFNFTPTMILNARLGYSRFREGGFHPSFGAVDPASLGFSAATVALIGGARVLPSFGIGGFESVGGNVAGYRNYHTYILQPTLTKLIGGHSWRFGYDGRMYRESSFGQGAAAGSYSFGTSFTRGPLDNSPSAPIGQELASFLLGLPTGGSLPRNAERSNQSLFHAFFAQDDWKISRKLTLNLGLRYEYDGPANERYNRNVRGFDFTSSSPIEAAAKAAYAANPIPELAPANFNVKGGLLFAGDRNRGFYDAETNNIQPRIGAAWQVTENTVLRVGFGMYMIPFLVNDFVSQSGFSLATQLVPTLDNGLSFAATLANPFPTGALTPPGASGGLATLLGQGVNASPLEKKNGQVQKWVVSLQRELPGQLLVEASYVGTRGYDLSTGIDLNPVPARFLSNSPVRDQNVINFLSANVANPFRNLIPGTGLNGATVSRSQLLRPFPHFTGVGSQAFDGRSNYHSGQFRVEKRFNKGYTLNLAYTWSKLLEETALLNSTDTRYEKRVAGGDTPDIPHRFVASGIWDLPLGRGRKFGAQWPVAVDLFLGGWKFGAIYQVQSGEPLTLGNLYYNGDPSKLRTEISSGTLDRIFDTSGFYFTDAAVQTNGVVDPVKQRGDQRILLGSNIRTLPTRFSGFRGHNVHNWDLSMVKRFKIYERLNFQLRADFLNAFNRTQFSDPNLSPTNTNFGRITSTLGLPRHVQLGLRLEF
ncbi:MAG: carboxypeptidase-like regulatory domain-containing protein [Acidobacteria bacterium]|nr:carboxypeptidase-like regulatory domain-containing protein [Acidobacteriota bacterium]